MNTDDIELIETCSACPEQYDAIYRGTTVGYLRLRHGWFYVAVGDDLSTYVFEASPEGDGMFEPHERDGYLSQARAAIAAYYSSPTNRVADR